MLYQGAARLHLPCAETHLQNGNTLVCLAIPSAITSTRYFPHQFSALGIYDDDLICVAFTHLPSQISGGTSLD